MTEILSIRITPLLFMLILWWFTTGAIMAVFRLSPRKVRVWYGGATLLMIGAMVGLAWTAQQQETIAVYGAVTCGTLVWGWQVASYYLGFITGTTQTESVAEKSDTLVAKTWVEYIFPMRFRRAFMASLYHELVIVFFLILIAGITLPYPNRWGFWIFLALWLMHSSAKLNVFFGVRNFRIDFLPEHLHGLKQLISKQKYNHFFPFSICVAVSTALFLIYQIIDPAASQSQTIGATLVVTMILLGIFEHWMLILPLPFTLWGWGIRLLPKQLVEN